MRQDRLQLEQQRTHHIFENEQLPIINATPEEMYRIAQINPKLFGTKYTRWGCNFKCVKCNGYRVNTGGKRSLIEISRVVNEQKYEHRRSCKHPKWKEEWSLHAAEIDHTFVEQTTEQSHTGDADWTDISGATITSGNFTTDRKYLFMHNSWRNASAVQRDFRLRAVHGSTSFTESEQSHEPQDTTAWHKIAWFTVWTAVSSEAIKLQHAMENTGTTIIDDTISLLAMEISEDLTEGSDWDFAHDSSTRSLTASFVADASLTIQSADHTAGDTYLVMGYSRIDPNAANVEFETRLARSGEATSTLPYVRQEGEDVNQNKMLHFLARPYDLGASDNTFAVECARETSTGGDVLHSSVFAINMEKFVDSSEQYQDGTIALGTTDWADLVSTLTFTPTSTGDFFILAMCIINPNGSSFCQTRMQVDGSDEPTGQTARTAQFTVWDGQDQINHQMFTVENLDDTSHTVDVDGDTSSTTGTPDIKQRTLVQFSMELVSSGAALVKVVTLENVNISDANINTVIGLIKNITTENVNLSEAHNEAMIMFRNVTTENVNISESLNRAMIMFRNVTTENVNINESLNRVKVIGAKVLNESINVTEGTILGILGIVRVVALETINITEGVIKKITTSIAIIKNIPESINISEALNKVQALSRTVTLETINITEVKNRLRTLVRIIPESINISESLNQAMVLVRNVTTENVNISESVNKLKSILKVIDETLNISETLLKIIRTPAVFTTRVVDAVIRLKSTDATILKKTLNAILHKKSLNATVDE